MIMYINVKYIAVIGNAFRLTVTFVLHRVKVIIPYLKYIAPCYVCLRHLSAHFLHRTFSHVHARVY